MIIGTTGTINLSRILQAPGQRRMPRLVSITSLERIQGEPIGWVEDAPREPLPLNVVIANLKKLEVDPDPAVRAQAFSYDLMEHALAQARYDAWSLRA